MKSTPTPLNETRSLTQQYLQSPFSIRYTALAALLQSEEGCEFFGTCAEPSDAADAAQSYE